MRFAVVNTDQSRQRQKLNTGISPLRRQSAPPSVEMTFCGVWVKETKAAAPTTANDNSKRQQQTTTADPYGMTNKKTSNGKATALERWPFSSGDGGGD
jgi:hypothetical protein